MKRAEAKRRALAIVEAYRSSNVSQREIAERFGMSPGHVSLILGRHGARNPERNAALQRARWERGDYDGVEFNQGRKPVWPDCPPELEPEYLRLRKHYRYPAAEARAMLEAA